jgi:hypothetical protein
LRGQWFIIMFSFSNGHKLWILPNVGESITIYIYCCWLFIPLYRQNKQCWLQNHNFCWWIGKLCLN